MRLPSRLGVQSGVIVLLSSFSLFAQTSADPVSVITAALRAGEFAKALEILQPALRQSSGNAQLWTLQGLAYSGEGHKKEALASFRNALKISPDYLPALEGASQLAYESGDRDAPILLQHVLRLVPSDPTAHAMLAALACKRNNCPEAIAHFEQSGALLESQPVALREYGVCLARAKRYEKAIAVFQKLIVLKPDEQYDRVRLAALQVTTGRTADAIETLQPALQRQPDSTVLSLAAEAYEAQKATPRAVELLRQAIVQDPRNIDLYLQFADLSFVHQSFQVPNDLLSLQLGVAVCPWCGTEPPSRVSWVRRGGHG